MIEVGGERKPLQMHINGKKQSLKNTLSFSVIDEHVYKWVEENVSKNAPHCKTTL